MHNRKVQQVGGGTYTVSLPKAWAEAVGVTAGSTVTLRAHVDDTLQVQPTNHEADTRHHVTLSRADRQVAIEDALRSAYVVGADRVTLRATDSFADEQRRTIEAATRELAGATVHEETRHAVTVHILLASADVSLRQSLRQLAFLACAMHRSVRTWLAGDGDLADATSLGAQTARLDALIERCVSRGVASLDEMDALGLTRPELVEFQSTARELARFADCAGAIAHAEGGTPTPADGDVATLLDVATRSVAAIDRATAVIADPVPPADTAQLTDAQRDLEAALDSLTRTRSDNPHIAVHRVQQAAEHGCHVAALAHRSIVRRRRSRPHAGLASDGANANP